MEWTAQQRAFALATYWGNDYSLQKTQAIFRKHYNLAKKAKIPTHTAIKEWQNNFSNTGSVMIPPKTLETAVDSSHQSSLEEDKDVEEDTGDKIEAGDDMTGQDNQKLEQADTSAEAETCNSNKFKRKITNQVQDILKKKIKLKRPPREVLADQVDDVTKGVSSDGISDQTDLNQNSGNLKLVKIEKGKCLEDLEMTVKPEETRVNLGMESLLAGVVVKTEATPRATTVDVGVNTETIHEETDSEKPKKSKLDKPPKQPGNFPILPTQVEINKLRDYVKAEHDKTFKVLLKAGYTFEKWKYLGEATLSLIYLLNSRRVKDLEAMTIATYKTKKDQPCTNVDHKDGPACRCIYTIGGKLEARPILLHTSLNNSVDLILNDRLLAGVPSDNPYIFGIPSKGKEAAHISANEVLKKFAASCGAEFPERLTKKLIKEKSDSNKGFLYQIQRLTAAAGSKPLNSDSQTDAKSMTNHDSDLNSDSDSDDSIPLDRYKTKTPKPRDSRVSVPTFTRRRWSDKEKFLADKLYIQTIEIMGEYPSLFEAELYIKKHRDLQERTAPQLMAYLSNKRKKEVNMYG